VLHTREDSTSSEKHSECCDGLGAALDGCSVLLLLLLLPPLHASVVERASPLNIARRLHCTGNAGAVSASRRAALGGWGIERLSGRDATQCVAAFFCFVTKRVLPLDDMFSTISPSTM